MTPPRASATLSGVSRWLSLLLVVPGGCTGAAGDGPGPAGASTGTTPGSASSGSTPLDESGSGSAGSLGSSGEAVDPTQWLCPADPDATPRFELGWDYKDGWIDLEPDGPVVITIGGQGAWMVPLGVRGDGFCVPADPSDYDHVPPLDITIEAEGLAEPVAMVTDFPVSFEPIDEGGLGYTFIPMMIADHLEVQALEGLATTIRAELHAHDVPPLHFALDGFLTISD